MRTKQIPLLLLLAFVVGCGSLYTGVVTITKVVDTTMKAYADLVHQGLVSAPVQQQVRSAYGKYQVAAAVAEDALKAYKAGASATSYQQALQTARDAAQSILDLIIPLLTPSKGSAIQAQFAKARTL